LVLAKVGIQVLIVCIVVNRSVTRVGTLWLNAREGRYHYQTGRK